MFGGVDGAAYQFTLRLDITTFIETAFFFTNVDTSTTLGEELISLG